MRCAQNRGTVPGTCTCYKYLYLVAAASGMRSKKKSVSHRVLVLCALSCGFTSSIVDLGYTHLLNDPSGYNLLLLSK
jgi:hypothetical protein